MAQIRKIASGICGIFKWAMNRNNPVEREISQETEACINKYVVFSSLRLQILRFRDDNAFQT